MSPLASHKLWQEKLAQLERFAAVTAAATPEALSEVLDQRQAVIAAVVQIDAALAGEPPSPGQREQAQRLLAAATEQQNALQASLERLLQERTARLLAAVASTRTEEPSIDPRFMDRQA